jgi:repressor LexA
MARHAKEITKRQEELLLIIYEYIRTTGYPPTFEEMRVALGVSSNQSIIDLLEKLQESGTVQKREGARSLVILPLGYQLLQKDKLVPFVGMTSAGAPIDPVEITGEWQAVSGDVAQFAEEVFLLRILGDSMINAGIDDGDVVLIQSKKEFYTREIVLAQVSDEKTVKRFISEDKPPYVYLKPENPNYENILFTDDVELQGKVVSVLKDGQWKSIK